MKELTVKKWHNEKYDIDVTCYLTAEQIGNIINAMHGFDNYHDRIKARDLMILAYCTDIPHDKIDEIGHDMFVQSGLMDWVLYAVENVNVIEDGLKWSEGIERAIIQISKRLPELETKLGELNKANSKLAATKGV